MKGLKTGGRQKGTPNKETAFVGLLLEKRGFNLVNEAMQLYSGADDEMKIRILTLLFPYVYPKRVDSPPDESIDITPENELAIATETFQQIINKFPQLLAGKDE